MILAKDLAASDYAPLPIIIAPGRGYEGLEECLKRIGRADDDNSSPERSQSPRVFHPCAALEAHPYDLNGRALCLGFPGSGNVLVQTIMGRLLPRIRDRIYSLPIAGVLVADHQRMWRTLLQAKLGVSSDEVVFLPQDMGHVSIRVTCEDGRFLDLYGINCPHWHTAYFVPAHVLPSGNETAEWTGCGGSVVIILRHPLDTIVSCAAKRLRPPTRLLGELGWFRRAVKTLVEYIDHAHSLPGDKLIVRYEDLLQRPHAQIMRLAQFLGASMTLDETGALWDEVWLKELVPAQAFNRTQRHYYQPGVGKWIRDLDVRHARIIEEEGLKHRMLDIGYSWEHDRFKTVYETEPPLREGEIKQAQTGDFFHFLFGAPRCFDAGSLYQARLAQSSINYLTNTEGFARAIESMDAECLADYQATAEFTHGTW